MAADTTCDDGDDIAWEPSPASDLRMVNYLRGRESQPPQGLSFLSRSTNGDLALVVASQRTSRGDRLHVRSFESTRLHELWSGMGHLSGDLLRPISERPPDPSRPLHLLDDFSFISTTGYNRSLTMTHVAQVGNLVAHLKLTAPSGQEVDIQIGAHGIASIIYRLAPGNPDAVLVATTQDGRQLQRVTL